MISRRGGTRELPILQRHPDGLGAQPAKVSLPLPVKGSNGGSALPGSLIPFDPAVRGFHTFHPLPLCRVPFAALRLFDFHRYIDQVSIAPHRIVGHSAAARTHFSVRNHPPGRILRLVAGDDPKEHEQRINIGQRLRPVKRQLLRLLSLRHQIQRIVQHVDRRLFRKDQLPSTNQADLQLLPPACRAFPLFRRSKLRRCEPRIHRIPLPVRTDEDLPAMFLNRFPKGLIRHISPKNAPRIHSLCLLASPLFPFALRRGTDLHAAPVSMIHAPFIGNISRHRSAR